MKGLEVSEIKYSYVKFQSDVFRFDSFYYSKEFLSDENIISNQMNKSLKELNANLLSFGAYSLNNFVEYKDSGIPFIRGVNMKGGILDFSDIIYIDEFAHHLLWKSEVKPNTVLLSMSGTIGDVAIAIPEYSYPMNSNQDIAKITLNGKLNPFYLYTFLRSKYGQNFLLREARGSVQQHVFLSQIENIRIPLLSEKFQLQIEQTVKSAHGKLADSKSLYSEAEEILLTELGLKNWQPDSKAVNVKTLKESFLRTGRLDSEYYLPRYEDYVRLMERYCGGCDEFGSVCSVNEANYVPVSNAEYRYIELGDIGNCGEITGCTVAAGQELPSRARRLVHTNDVILSSVEGSLQSCALVTSEYDNAICSTGFYVVRSAVMNSETLLMLFKSDPMQNLFKRNCTGTILTAVSHNELKKIPVPKIRAEVQAEIAENVQKSISLRDEAKSLLEGAKQEVEDAIEYEFARGGVQVNSNSQENADYDALIEQSVYYYRLAEWLLLQELLSQYWATLGAVNYSIKSFSDFQRAGRLDAEYYQPKYDKLKEKLSAHECRALGDIVSIKKSVEPGSESYQESGIPFIRVSDVSEFGISQTDLCLSPCDFNLEALRPHKDTILLSKDGSICIAYKCEADLDVITSGALLHLTVTDSAFLPDYITLVLNSVVVRMQAERDSNGAIIQHWKPDDIKKVIIPALAMKTQRQIAEKVRRSFSLRTESGRLLEQAKEMVEAEIEGRQM